MRLTWAKRIKAARKRGRFTPNEVRLATSWTTCAVGEAVGSPAQYSTVWSRARQYGLSFLAGMPSAGLDFVFSVDRNDFDCAETVLARIVATVRAAKAAQRKVATRG